MPRTHDDTTHPLGCFLRANRWAVELSTSLLRCTPLVLYPPAPRAVTGPITLAMSTRTATLQGVHRRTNPLRESLRAPTGYVGLYSVSTGDDSVFLDLDLTLK